MDAQRVMILGSPGIYHDSTFKDLADIDWEALLDILLKTNAIRLKTHDRLKIVDEQLLTIVDGVREMKKSELTRKNMITYLMMCNILVTKDVDTHERSLHFDRMNPSKWYIQNNDSIGLKAFGSIHKRRPVIANS